MIDLINDHGDYKHTYRLAKLKTPEGYYSNGAVVAIVMTIDGEEYTGPMTTNIVYKDTDGLHLSRCAAGDLTVSEASVLKESGSLEKEVWTGSYRFTLIDETPDRFLTKEEFYQWWLMSGDERVTYEKWLAKVCTDIQEHPTARPRKDKETFCTGKYTIQRFVCSCDDNDEPPPGGCAIHTK